MISGVVLPGRIELPTSALPRMRSTTELRQHGPEMARTDAGTGRMAIRPQPVKRVSGHSLALAAAARSAMVLDMTKETEAQARARAERLAAALRANLRKRKGLGDRADPTLDQHPAPSREPD